jgi:hypothetical protein
MSLEPLVICTGCGECKGWALPAAAILGATIGSILTAGTDLPPYLSCPRLRMTGLPIQFSEFGPKAPINTFSLV